MVAREPKFDNLGNFEIQTLFSNYNNAMALASTIARKHDGIPPPKF